MLIGGTPHNASLSNISICYKLCSFNVNFLHLNRKDDINYATTVKYNVITGECYQLLDVITFDMYHLLKAKTTHRLLLSFG